MGSASMLEPAEGFDYWTLHAEWVPVTIPSGAAGAALTKSVPGSVEWEVLSASFLYTASAAAANRIPFFSFLDRDGVTVGKFATPYKLVATDVSQISFGVYVTQFGADSAANIGCAIPPLRLGDGMRVQMSAAAISAADTITNAKLYVRQWRVRE